VLTFHTTTQFFVRGVYLAYEGAEKYMNTSFFIKKSSAEQSCRMFQPSKLLTRIKGKDAMTDFIYL
jgi:predicted DNA repair protein MutK